MQKIKRMPWQVLLAPADVVDSTESPVERLAKCHMIYTLTQDCFRAPLGRLTEDAFTRIRAGLDVALTTSIA